jgi:hypothetical protein
MRSIGVLCITCVVLALVSFDTPRIHGQAPGKTLTGIWEGTYTNEGGDVSKGYLDITENADGTLSGKWGNDPEAALKIENGERVTKHVFQWEASSEANEKGRYRCRATLKGKTLELDITYTWREDGKVKGTTATSALTRK